MKFLVVDDDTEHCGTLRALFEESGYLVEFDQDPVTSFPRDPEKFARDLAARINEMLSDPGRCRRFGDAGRKRVEEIFSWTAIAQQTIQLYERLIAQRNSNAGV